MVGQLGRQVIGQKLEQDIELAVRFAGETVKVIANKAPAPAAVNSRSA